MSKRIIKTISLDSMTASMADNIPNFSAWVRQQLIIEHIAQGGQQLHIVEKELRTFKIKMPTQEIDSYGRRKSIYVEVNKCNPYHSKGVCSTCWPPERSPEAHIAAMVREHMGEEE